MNHSKNDDNSNKSNAVDTDEYTYEGFNWLKAMMNHIKTKYLLQLESECKDKLSLLNAQEVALKKDL